jgi:DNA-binding CsgD family transcriptional regulator
VQLTDLSAVPGTDDRFLDFIGEICDRLELDYASYATMNPVTGDVQGYANYPDEWKHFYMRKEMHRFDPTLWTSARSIAPVDWSRFERDTKFHAVFDAASEFGIASQGLTVPIRGPYGDCGLLCVSRAGTTEDWRKQRREIINELQTAAVHLHDAVMRSDVLTRALHMPNLSRREHEILQWTAAGKTQTEIGDILSISYRTVEVHLRSAREKLGALTTAQAVARGIGLGLIYPR